MAPSSPGGKVDEKEATADLILDAVNNHVVVPTERALEQEVGSRGAPRSEELARRLVVTPTPPRRRAPRQAGATSTPTSTRRSSRSSG